MLPDPTAQTGIPRIIHQTHRSADLLPPFVQWRIRRLRRLNPGWEHRFYDNAAAEDFVRNAYPPQVLASYLRINPAYGAARADLFRYLLMYRLGGVYLDVKSTAALPLDNVLRPDDSYLLAQWGADTPMARWGLHPELADLPGGEFQNWHIICAPGHPFLHAVINRVLANIDTYSPFGAGVGRLGTVRLTGPVAYSLAIAPLLAQHPHRRLCDEREIGLVYSIYGQNTQHSRALGSEYRRRTAPVARLSPLMSALWWPVRLRLHAARLLRRAARQIGTWLGKDE